MGTHPLIYIRTDGNSQIASGHLMRCLSIASACQSLGMEVCFLVSEGESHSLLNEFLRSEDCCFQVICLKTAIFNHLDQELPEVLALLHSHQKEPVYLLDSYYVTEHYLTAINPFAKVAYLDDLQLFDYPVDLLINYDVIPADTLPSYKAAYQNSKKLLLGSTYAPLRKQFQNSPVAIKEQAKSLLVTTGGSDPCHFCLRLLKAIDEVPSAWPFSATGLRMHMVIGKLNTDRAALHKLSDALPFSNFLQLHENVTDMASLMQSCDLAISAAGTTLYELCALGIPAISFTMADNQMISAKAFAAAGAIPCAGDIREHSESMMQPFMKFVISMSGLCSKQSSEISSYTARKAAHKAMRKLVDGNGALRIAKALGEL